MEVVDIVTLRAQFLSRLHEVLREAETAFEREYDATTRIQSAFRGWRVRSHLAEFHYYAREIQRVFRGHCGRKLVRIALDDVYEARKLAVRHYSALVIQRHFRGWYSRKHVHDYYVRKAYIHQITAKGEMLRAEVEAAVASQLRAHLEKEETKQREEFDKITRGLHHLVSTKVQPGVYNPPWAANMDAVPSAFGVPLETHLRLGVLRELRTTGLYPASRTATLKDTLTGTRRPADADMIDPATGLLKAPKEGDHAAASRGLGAGPLAAIGHRNVLLVPAYVNADKRSLQASAPYDAVEVAARKERRHSKYKQLDQRPFLAGGNAPIIGQMVPLGVNATEPFIEEHIRARNTRELEWTTNRHMRLTAAPFIPASSRASRMFEDTERRRVAQAAALIAHVTSPQATRSRPLGTLGPDGFAATQGTLRLPAESAVEAIKAGMASSAIRTAILPTKTLRQGHVVAVVAPDGGAAMAAAGGGQGQGQGLGPVEFKAPQFTPYNPYTYAAPVAAGGEVPQQQDTVNGTSAFSAAGVAAGSGIAAARRARKAGATGVDAGGTARSLSPVTNALGNTLMMSRGTSATPFAVTVTRTDGNGMTAQPLVSTAALSTTGQGLLGVDPRGTLVHQPGTAGAAVAVPGAVKRPSRPLMKPPHVVQAHLAQAASTRHGRTMAAAGAAPLVPAGPDPTPVELAGL